MLPSPALLLRPGNNSPSFNVLETRRQTTDLKFPRHSGSNAIREEPARKLTSIRDLLNVVPSCAHTEDVRRNQYKPEDEAQEQLQGLNRNSNKSLRPCSGVFGTRYEANSRIANRQSNADDGGYEVVSNTSIQKSSEQDSKVKSGTKSTPTTSTSAVSAVPLKRKASFPSVEKVGHSTSQIAGHGVPGSAPRSIQSSLHPSMRKRNQEAFNSRDQGHEQGHLQPPDHYQLGYNTPYSNEVNDPVTTQFSPEVEAYKFGPQANAKEELQRCPAQFQAEQYRATPTLEYPGYGFLGAKNLSSVPEDELEHCRHSNAMLGVAPSCYSRYPLPDISHIQSYHSISPAHLTHDSSSNGASVKSEPITPSSTQEIRRSTTKASGAASTSAAADPHLTKNTSPRYGIFCRQQPVHARMCGFGEKDRRTLDPPPIVECFEIDDLGRRLSDPPRDPYLTLHVTLWNDDCSDERNLIATSQIKREQLRAGDEVQVPGAKITRVLMGSLVASPTKLEDDFGNRGAFFVFPDLSIRTEGSYRLKFRMFSMNTVDVMTPGARTVLVGECVTDPFIVYSAKKFPGMLRSTNVSCSLFASHYYDD